MEFLDELIRDYCFEHTSDMGDVLADLERYTHTNTTAPRMLSGAFQGRFLNLLVKIRQPKKILEIGTFTGYSAIAMAMGLGEGGIIDTIDIDEEKKSVIEDFIAKAGLGDKINLHIGDARSIINNLAGPYDFVFIDADKKNYSIYYDMVIDKVSKGGVILADNMLWSGKVVEEKVDESTQALKDYNDKVVKDPRVESILLPIRDGIMMSVRC